MATEDQRTRFLFTGDPILELLADRLIKEAFGLPHIDQLKHAILLVRGGSVDCRAQDDDEFFEDANGERVKVVGVSTLRLEDDKDVVDEVDNVSAFLEFVDESHTLQKKGRDRLSISVVIKDPRCRILDGFFGLGEVDEDFVKGVPLFIRKRNGKGWGRSAIRGRRRISVSGVVMVVVEVVLIIVVKVRL